MDKKAPWVIGLLVVAFLFMGTNLDTEKKEAGLMTRDFSASTVQSSTNFDVTYTSSSTGFNGIEDTIPAGFTLVTTGDSLVSLNGNLLKVAWTGTSKTITLKSATAEGSYLFTGIFEGTSGVSGDIGGEFQIVIQNCVPQSTQACVGGDLYWFDSCGTQEGVAQSCGVDTSGDWSENICKGNNVVQTKLIQDRGCDANACFENTGTDEQTIEVCSWQCSVDTCQRNTIADENNDGTLTLAEVIAYAEKWVASSGPTLSQVIGAAEVWVSDGISPVDVPGGV